MYKKILKRLLLDHFTIYDRMHPACDIQYCHYEPDGLWENDPDLALELKKLYIQFELEDKNAKLNFSEK